jgi:tetratricopeptide (TPR) repeat protein
MDETTQRPARPVHGDSAMDLALLHVPGLAAARLGMAGEPGSGDRVDVLGIRADVLAAPLRWLDGLSVGVEARRSPGDSGGPVLHAGGLLGVVTGAAEGELEQGLAIGAGPHQIAAFLGQRRRSPCTPRAQRVARTLSSAQQPADPARALAQLAALPRPWSRTLTRAVHSRRARLLVLLDRLEEAEAELDAQLEGGGDDARARLDRIRVRLLAQRPMSGSEWSALSDQPEIGVLLRMAADQAEQRGRPASAVALLDALISSAGPLPHLLAARCRARTLFGDLAGALEDCEGALRDPSRPLWALLDLAAVHLSLRRATAALSLLDEAAARAEGPAVLLLRASARLAARSPFPAATELEPALRAALQDTERVLQAGDARPWTLGPAWFLAGVALHGLGDREGARAAALAAVAASPGEARIAALLLALDADAPIHGIDGAGVLLLGDPR